MSSSKRRRGRGHCRMITETSKSFRSPEINPTHPQTHSAEATLTHKNITD